jgi:hypothetical protein
MVKITTFKGEEERYENKWNDKGKLLAKTETEEFPDREEDLAEV